MACTVGLGVLVTRQKKPARTTRCPTCICVSCLCLCRPHTAHMPLLLMPLLICALIAMPLLLCALLAMPLLLCALLAMPLILCARMTAHMSSTQHLLRNTRAAHCPTVSCSVTHRVSHTAQLSQCNTLAVRKSVEERGERHFSHAGHDGVSSRQLAQQSG